MRYNNNNNSRIWWEAEMCTGENRGKGTKRQDDYLENYYRYFYCYHRHHCIAIIIILRFGMQRKIFFYTVKYWVYHLYNVIWVFFCVAELLDATSEQEKDSGCVCNLEYFWHSITIRMETLIQVAIRKKRTFNTEVPHHNTIKAVCTSNTSRKLIEF